jgi:hypothetical protein
MFIEKLNKRIDAVDSMLCVGLDPDLKRLPAHLAKDAEGVLQFCCAIVDATAPHVMEPDAPGAEEQVVSLYHTLDADALHAHADEVKRLFAQNTALTLPSFSMPSAATSAPRPSSTPRKHSCDTKLMR